MNTDGWRIGVDIGGTFTDVVLLGPGGTMTPLKVLSTPPDIATNTRCSFMLIH